MERPRATIWLDDETDELTKTDLLIRFGSRTVKVRQVAVFVQIAQSHVKNAALRVAIRGRDIPRAIRYPRSGEAGWGDWFEPIISQEEPSFKDEKAVASAVHKILSGEQKRTLEGGMGYVATILFTIEGHSNAYVTTKIMYDLPMRKTYRLVTRLIGERLTFPPTQGIYVELNDWNDIYVNYDYDYIRTYRAVVRWAKSHYQKFWKNKMASI